MRGQWVYLYRAVDQAGQTVDFYGSRQRDVNAAKAFLRQAMKPPRIATKITLDAYAASHRAVADWKQAGELPKGVKVRSSKYLNHLIEQDHGRVKQRLGPMLGLKSFGTGLGKIFMRRGCSTGVSRRGFSPADATSTTGLKWSKSREE